jgi:diacylglycerol kinase family enzyme
MQRPRRQKETRVHVCILANESAAAYRSETVEKLVARIKSRGGKYTVLKPRTANDLADAAHAVCGLRRGRRLLPQQFARRGRVTTLVAGGGDGTFNLVARAALAADLPVGLLPMGRFNNIANSLYRDLSMNASIKRIIERSYRLIDVATVAGQPFFGAIGLGLTARLARLLTERKTPRLSLGWSRLIGQAVDLTEAKKSVIKVDAFRFEVNPIMLNVNLLPHTNGLAMTPASLPNDQKAEIIFDMGATRRELASYARQIAGGRFVYGSEVRLFRGSVISIQPTRGRTLYLDGELVKLPTNLLEIKISDKQLKVYR